jgi:glycerol-3-phosphate dehydrogenase
VVYHDGQFDDARLALNLAQTIAEKGGTVLNYCKVNGLQKTEGNISGVSATDVETSKTYNIAAKVVVNATGVFVDDILKMDEASRPKTICVSQGVHLVFDKAWYSSANALMIPKTTDGRVLFAVPWHNKVLLGTTDTPVEQPSLEPLALEKEIEFILTTAGHYLEKQPGRSDVLSVFAGLRPLAAPVGEAKKTREISRSHKIVVSGSGLFTILGGKWTTYRKMGEDMVNVIERKSRWKNVKSATGLLKVHGYSDAMKHNDPLRVYGSDAIALREWMAQEPDAWISSKLGIHTAQVLWAVQHEMARTVEDVLSRRTRALLLDAAESIAVAPAVAKVMAQQLGCGEDWINVQVQAYTALAKNYLPQ